MKKCFILQLPCVKIRKKKKIFFRRRSYDCRLGLGQGDGRRLPGRGQSQRQEDQEDEGPTGLGQSGESEKGKGKGFLNKTKNVANRVN